jgi:hypothetical protein
VILNSDEGISPLNFATGNRDDGRPALTTGLRREYLYLAAHRERGAVALLIERDSVVISTSAGSDLNPLLIGRKAHGEADLMVALGPMLARTTSVLVPSWSALVPVSSGTL